MVLRRVNKDSNTPHQTTYNPQTLEELRGLLCGAVDLSWKLDKDALLIQDCTDFEEDLEFSQYEKKVPLQNLVEIHPDLPEIFARLEYNQDDIDVSELLIWTEQVWENRHLALKATLPVNHRLTASICGGEFDRNVNFCMSEQLLKQIERLLPTEISFQVGRIKFVKDVNQDNAVLHVDLLDIRHTASGTPYVNGAVEGYKHTFSAADINAAYPHGFERLRMGWQMMLPTEELVTLMMDDNRETIEQATALPDLMQPKVA